MVDIFEALDLVLFNKFRIQQYILLVSAHIDCWTTTVCIHFVSIGTSILNNQKSGLITFFIHYLDTVLCYQ